MGLLSSTTPFNESLIEGVVMAVDSYRQCCEVTSIHGQKLTGVIWLSPSGGNSRTGQHICPTVGDKVVLSFALGYPLIMGFLPGLAVQDVYPATLDTGVGTDTGNLSSSQSPSATFNPGCPVDSVSGDHIFTSEGGGIIALLRQGTVVLRSTKLAQILISKFDDLVRIVARNYEVFTDVFVDVSYNVKSRIYRYKGYATTQAKVRNDEYEYEEFLGDTALAEAAKQEGFSTDLATAPARNSVIKKVKVAGKFTHILELSGHYNNTVVNGGTSSRDQIGAAIVDKVIGGGTSTVSVLGSSIILNQDSSSIVTLTKDSIKLDQSGSSTVTLTASDVKVVHGGSTVTVDAGGIKLEFGGHGIVVDAGGVHTT